MSKNRITITFLFFIFVLIASSCSINEEPVQQSIIKEADLTEKEEALIKGTGVNHSFVFEYQNNQDIENIDVWIEKYLGGEKIGPVLKTTNILSDDLEKYIMFNMSAMQEQTTWSISFIEGKNISTGKIDSRNELGKTSTWDTVKNMEVNEGEYILAAFVGNDSKNINGIPNDFFTEPNEYMSEILLNDYVYLLKIKLY